MVLTKPPKASKACFAQDATCYSSAPPTGSKNCPIWEAKCKGIQDACKAGNFNGPPNRGKDLNPPLATSYSIPPVDTMTNVVFSFLSKPTATEPTLYISESIAPGSLVTDSYDTAALETSTPQSRASTSAVTALATTVLTNRHSTPSIPLSSTTASTHPPTPTSSVPPPSPKISISQDATCGSELNLTCLNSAFGSCCSQYGWCGVTDAYCGEGCQAAYGTCGQGTFGYGKTTAGAAAKKSPMGKRFEHMHLHRHVE